MKNYWTIFTNGLVKENPLLVLMIGLCSSLAVTTSFSNGLGMGLAMTFVLLMSEIIISLFRKLIPDSIHVPSYCLKTFFEISPFFKVYKTSSLSFLE